MKLLSLLLLLTTYVEYAAHKDYSVELTMLKHTSAGVGRTAPIYDQYRPQFHFAGSEATCTVTLPAGRQKVEPGEIADVVINCEAPFKVDKEHPQASITEGARKVAIVTFK